MGSLNQDNPYTYRVVWSEEDKEFVGLCNEFPSLSWLCEKEEEALKGIVNLVTEVVADNEAESKVIYEVAGVLFNVLDKIVCEGYVEKAVAADCVIDIAKIILSSGIVREDVKINSCVKN